MEMKKDGMLRDDEIGHLILVFVQHLAEKGIVTSFSWLWMKEVERVTDGFPFRHIYNVMEPAQKVIYVVYAKKGYGQGKCDGCEGSQSVHQ